MINPHSLTDFKRTDAELEEALLFSIAVAGKTAVVIAAKIDRFLWLARQRVGQNLRTKKRHLIRVLDFSPFRLLRCLRSMEKENGRNEFLPLLKKAKVGKYSVLVKAYREIADLSYDDKINLRTWTVNKFREIHGVGPKTARMFILHSRPNIEFAVPDTHILAELTERGYKVPKVSPTSEIWLNKIDQYVKSESVKDGMTMAEWDLAIWRKRTKTKPNQPRTETVDAA